MIYLDPRGDTAADLSGWDVQQVAPGRHLVKAKDLAPWYSGSDPDPAVLEPGPP